MDDRIRASDADRERVTARLRDHYAEGRLTSEELDERTSAALHAKTFGDLRHVMADLPDPVLMPQLLVLVFALLAPGPGGWVLFAFFKLFLVFWLVTGLAAFVFARRFRRRMSQGGPGGYPQHDYSQHGHSQHGHSQHGHSQHGHSQHGHSRHGPRHQHWE
jgi:hypothetical protein